MSRLAKFLLPPLILIAAVVAARGLVAGRQPLQTRAEPPLPPLVETRLLGEGGVELQLYSEGTVQTKEKVQLTADISGRVIWLSPRFLVGEVVEADEPLLRIDPTNYQLALAQAQLALRDAELSLADARTRFSRSSAHPQLRRAEAQVEAASAQLAKARQDLERTELRSPLRAVVDRKQVSLGQHVNAAAVLGELLATAAVEIPLPLSADELQLLGDRPGQPVTLSARAGSRQLQWPARISRLRRQLDPQTRVAYAIAEVHDPYGFDKGFDSEDADARAMPLRIGQFVQAEIGAVVLPGAQRIPNSALFDDRYVYTVDADNRLRRREVRLLRHERDSAVISNGLAAGERLVLSRLELMTDGMAVRIAGSGN